MDKEIERRLETLEKGLILNQTAKLDHRHCVDCNTSLFLKPPLSGYYVNFDPSFSYYDGRLINGKLHCENCARLHDPPPPRADHTHEEIKPKKDK